MNKTLPVWIPGLLLTVGSAAFLGFTKLHMPQKPIASAQSQCQPASGKVYSGVQLYLDSQCNTSLATVIGGSEQYKGFDGNPQRAIKLLYPSGSAEWKRRDELTSRAYVKIDDPAIAAQQWQEPLN